MLVLLYTRRPMSKAQIRQLVPQYGQSASTEAFERMFERDKDELRELGIPLVTQDIDPLHEDEPGYRIDQREYALPDIAFEPDELAVLGLASRTWAQASLAGPAAQALRKLRAAGVERDVDALIGIEPRLRTTEPAFDAVKDGVVRPCRCASPTGAPRPPRRGAPRAAVVAHLVARPLVPQRLRRRPGAPRVFRLSRIVGAVRTAGRPGPSRCPTTTSPSSWSPASPRRRPSRARPCCGCAGARDTACAAGPHRRGGRRAVGPRRHRPPRPRGLRRGGHAGYGADVVVEQPPELVDAVVRRLRGALAAHGGGR